MIDSTEDGPHEDIAIARFLAHKEFDNFLWINDIGMIYLERDVQFTGISIEKTLIKTIEKNSISFFSTFNCLSFADRIGPICLPIYGDLRDRSFVSKTPFVAGWGMNLNFGFQSIQPV